MIFCGHGEAPFVLGIESSFRNCPGLKCAVHLKPEVIVQMAGMLLHYEPFATSLSAWPTGFRTRVDSGGWGGSRAGFGRYGLDNRWRERLLPGFEIENHGGRLLDFRNAMQERMYLRVATLAHHTNVARSFMRMYRRLGPPTRRGTGNVSIQSGANAGASFS
jgi:hypothetical protein